MSRKSVVCFVSLRPRVTLIVIVSALFLSIYNGLRVGEIATRVAAMAMGKQAKILNEYQLQALLSWLDTRQHRERNRLIVLLSFKAGLRAKEIASLKWSMVMDANGNIGDHIHLTGDASKGRGGRIIAINKELKRQLSIVQRANNIGVCDSVRLVIQTRARSGTSAQVIVNAFADWFGKLGFVGCSSHS
jgi:integrase